jgi:glutamine synthetase
VIRANIEAETAEHMAKTMILPAALRYLALVDESGIDSVKKEATPLVEALVSALGELDEANAYPEGDVEGLELAIYARDNQLAAMAKVREAADKLEKVVADDLWPLPKYAEMLFIR